MTTTALDARIASLEAKLKQQKTLRQKIEARRRTAEVKAHRAQDTRRKILVGAVILAQIERGEWPQAQLNALLEAALTRPDDRALFNLPPRTLAIPTQQTTAPCAAVSGP